jgi:uncharacterized protein (TIGR02270 family)
VLRDVHEEHLDEATFLWGQWETALEAPIYTLREVVTGPEERLLAHLDALVLGGPFVAEELLLPALDGDDLDAARVAAWALLQAEDTDHLDPVLGALAGAEPPKAGAIVRAMCLSTNPAIAVRLAAFWTHASPLLRSMILTVMARHDFKWTAERVPEVLRSDDPSLLAVALALVRQLPARNPAFTAEVERGLASAEPRVRHEAMATGFVLGSKHAHAACQRAVAAREPARLPFALLALGADEKDGALLRGCVKDPAVAGAALWALGFAGDVDAADAAAACLTDKKLAPSAAEAFSAITGLAISGPFTTPRPAAGDVGPDDPPPTVGPDDLLPVPAAEVIASWWRKNRGRFQPKQRYVAGNPRTPEALRASLVDGRTWRRAVVALEIAATTRTALTSDLTGWARSQLAR